MRPLQLMEKEARLMARDDLTCPPGYIEIPHESLETVRHCELREDGGSRTAVALSVIPPFYASNSFNCSMVLQC